MRLVPPEIVAVLDIGKSNVKLSAVTPQGQVLETLTTVNVVLPGPLWRHHDVTGLGNWIFSSLHQLCQRHAIRHIIPVGHGSCGVLVSDDPNGPDGGTALPMIDYEQDYPLHLNAAYAALAGDFYDRGSAIMQASTHQARQMFWMQQAEPAAFATAKAYLGLPQYWAWRMCGVAANEYSFLGAQSHLWNVAKRDFSPIVTKQGWARLMPNFRPAFTALGPISAELCRQFELPSGIQVHVGCHDSSCNFYRYRAAGRADLAVISTGTWIVALAGEIAPESLQEARGMTLNCDFDGRPVGGALTMGGREFSHVAGAGNHQNADYTVICQMIEQGTFALPTFGADSGQFPGSAGQGRIIGPAPQNEAERRALAVLYTALLTCACVDTLSQGRDIVLDGSFLAEPLFAPLVQAIRSKAKTYINTEPYGIAAGAALLCFHKARSAHVPISLNEPRALPYAYLLRDYASQWLDLARRGPHSA